jgi:hypothetical protein
MQKGSPHGYRFNFPVEKRNADAAKHGADANIRRTADTEQGSR